MAGYQLAFENTAYNQKLQAIYQILYLQSCVNPILLGKHHFIIPRTIISSQTIQKRSNTKIGLFGIGLQAYWAQFPGLEDRLKGYLNIVEKQMSAFDTDILNLGLVDTPEKAFEAGTRFKQEEVCWIFTQISPCNYQPLVVIWK